MTTKLLLALKKWSLLLVIAYTLALTIGSFARIKDIPDLGFSFNDKIYHFVAYFVFALLVFNYCKAKKYTRAFVISAFVVIVYGIIIEVLQYILTSHRSFDLYDVMANTLGVIFALLLLRYLYKLKLN